MSIMGVVYYDKYTDQHRIPGWARAERYEYCEDFYEGYTTGKISSLKSKVASILTSLFI